MGDSRLDQQSDALLAAVVRGSLDALVVIDEGGRVVEDGSHDALIKTGGRYASLHRLQAGIHEVH